MATKTMEKTRGGAPGAETARGRHAGPDLQVSSERQTRIEECVAMLRQELRRSDAAELDGTLALFQEILSRPARPHPSAKGDLVRRLSGGRTYTPAQEAALELRASQQAFATRQALLAGSLTATEVAGLLGTSRQTPHDRAGRNSLLAVMDQGHLRFPPWQFDPGGPNGVVAGLPDVLRVLDVSPLAKASWLTRPNPYLAGRTPLQALQGGDLARILDQARAVGAV